MGRPCERPSPIAMPFLGNPGKRRPAASRPLGQELDISIPQAKEAAESLLQPCRKTVNKKPSAIHRGRLFIGANQEISSRKEKSVMSSN